jgi:predicted MPP superfamily phosphohydrolase
MIGLPVIQKKGNTFQIEIKSEILNLVSANISVAISLDFSSVDNERNLIQESLNYDSDKDLWVLTATLPDDLPVGLYDLKVTVDGNELIRPNAVSVVSEFSTDPLIYHITDVHVDFSSMLVDSDYGINGNNWKERTQHFSRYLRDAKDLHADFILIGGDNVDWSTDVNWQWFYEALKQSEVPTFVQLGNHDYRDSSDDVLNLPEFYDCALKFFWDNICSKEHFMHYSFDYGHNLHIIGLDSGPDKFKPRPEICEDIAEILANTNGVPETVDEVQEYFKSFDFVQSKGLTSEQMAWLAEDLSDSRSNVLFFHNPVFSGEEIPYDTSVISNWHDFRMFCHDSHTLNKDILAVFSGHIHADETWRYEGTLFFITDQARVIYLSTLTEIALAE